MEGPRICTLHASLKQTTRDHEELLAHHLVHSITHALELTCHRVQARDALHLLGLKLRVRVAKKLERAEEVAPGQFLLHKRRRLPYASNMQRNVQQLPQTLPASSKSGHLRAY